MATIRVRNQATVGGNIAHADPAQDPPPMLIALRAHVVVASLARGVRRIDLDQFFIDTLSTVLEPDEILTEVGSAASPDTVRWSF